MHSYSNRLSFPQEFYYVHWRCKQLGIHIYPIHGRTIRAYLHTQSHTLWPARTYSIWKYVETILAMKLEQPFQSTQMCHGPIWTIMTLNISWYALDKQVFWMVCNTILYDPTFNTHCVTFNKAFLYAKNQLPAS